MQAFRTVFCLGHKRRLDELSGPPELYEGPLKSVLQLHPYVSTPFEASYTLWSPLTNLPPELIFNIFDFLPLSSVADFSLVSKRCHRLAQPVLKRSLQITQGNFVEILGSVLARRFDLSLVRRITLIQFYYDWDVQPLLDVVLVRFPNLNDLTLDRGAFIQGNGALAKMCEVLGDRLVSLDVTFCGPLLYGVSEVSSYQTMTAAIVSNSHTRGEWLVSKASSSEPTQFSARASTLR